mgnify:CR=1 FL=1
MSTILDALRKAQEDTGGKRQPPVDEHPAATGAMAPVPRRRRRMGWPAAVVAILAVAFAGGLALGDRVVAWFGGSTDAPSGPGDVRVASRDEPAAATQPTAPAVEQPPAEAEPTPIVRRGNRAARAESDPPRPAFAQTADSLVQQHNAAPEAAPTPYGHLHVFGAGEAPAQGKPSSEDRLARLQQLREKMMQARQKAAGQGREEESAPTQIFVPPPRDTAPAEGSKAAAPAPSAPSQEPAVEVARADAVAPSSAAERAAVGEPAAGSGADSIGVSVTDAQEEIRDPDIPQPQDAPVANPEPPTTVAAIAPDPASEAAPARAAAPPVLRRAPGGAPQVAINILQWSAEPARRFAFVSVDGGNMTQVREGDHIGGLTVKQIHQQMIEFGFNDSTFLLRAN